MKIDIYERNVFDEEDRTNNHSAYFKSGRGNRKCQHKILISNTLEVDNILNKYNLLNIIDEKISISILWNLPRRRFKEDKKWVSISGFTYNDRDFSPKHFVISNNIYNECDQSEAIKFIHDLIKLKDIKVSY